MDESPWILSVDATSLQRDVLERSRTTPVLLYFSAAWCGPCKTLGPALEERARRGAGRFLLAKVDIDQSPEVAQAFRVQAVPTVLAISEGRLLDGFQGALPEAELDRFLEVLGPAPTTDPLAAAREQVEGGDLEGAVEALRARLREAPEDDAARLLLARCLLDLGRVEEARRVHDKLAEEARASEEGRAIAKRLELTENAGDLEALEAALRAAPEDPRRHLELGQALVARSEYARGLEVLLEALRRAEGSPDADLVRQEAKKTMLEVFDVLGLEDPLANEYRFKLSLELFT